MVSVTATDPGGLTDTASVTITVEDVDETPEVSGPTSPEVAENGGRNVATDDEGLLKPLVCKTSGFRLSPV